MIFDETRDSEDMNCIYWLPEDNIDRGLQGNITATIRKTLLFQIFLGVMDKSDVDWRLPVPAPDTEMQVDESEVTTPKPGNAQPAISVPARMKMRRNPATSPR